MHSRRNPQLAESPTVTILNRVVDYGLACVLFVAPLAMGGRFAAGRLLLVSLIGLTATAWGFARFLSASPKRWLTTGAEWLAVLAVLLVLLQVLPLPTGMVQTLSPSLGELLPLHHGVDPGEAAETGSVIGWSYISLAPHDSRSGLAMALAYVLLFGVVSQRIRNRADVEFALKAIALAGISMAAIGLTQRFLGNGKFLWFMEHPSRDTLTSVKGTFANENHFVHFLALTLGPLLWWVVKEQGTTHREHKSFSFGDVRSHASRIPRNQIAPLAGLSLVSLAALLSFSRGGLVMMALAGVTTIGLFAVQKRVGRRAILGLGAVVMFASACVWIHGNELLVRELESLQTTSIDSLDQDHGRRKIWSAVLSAIPDFAIAGSGIGSHRYVYPTYFSDAASVQYTHAESGYLHVLLETGSLGFTLLLFAIGLSGYWLFRSLIRGRERLAFLSVPLISCWLVSVVHAVFDFNWFIPANMCLTLFVAAMASRLSSLSLQKTSTVPAVSKRMNWAVATCGIAVVAMFSAAQFVGPAKASPSYSEYKAWSLASNRFHRKSTGPGRQRNLGFVDPALPETSDRMIRLLDESLRADPYQGRAHVQMAALCLRQFDIMQKHASNPMDLAQIRDAALSSEFESHQEMVDWVMRATGDNSVYLQRVLWHAQRGVKLTPTEGNGYLYLGEVAFLDESLKGREHELLYQAYKVRPYDPSIQFVHGRHLLLSGNESEAMQLWKEAFRRGSRVRGRVIEAIGRQTSPQEILDVFQPDLGGLRDLFEFYRTQNFDPQMKYVGNFYVTELEKQAKQASGAQAGQLWFDAQFVHATLGNAIQAAQAADNSVLAQPGEYRNHYACALRMRDAGRWEDAVEQFRWCQQRKPENKELPIVINELNRMARQEKLGNKFRPANVGPQDQWRR